MLVLMVMALGLALAGAMLVVAVRSFGQERQSARRNQRLLAFGERARPNAAPSSGAGSASLMLAAFETVADARLVRWLPGAATIRDQLARTGRMISLAQYATWTALFAVITFVAGIILFHSVAVSAGVAVALGLVLPRMLLRRMAARRLAKFTQQFPDAIDLIVRALRAGLPLSEALVTIAQEAADPVGIEFRRVVGWLAIGRPVEAALWEMERHIDSAELRFFIISIATQTQTGGNLGDTLGNLADILRQRALMRMKIKAMTGEARTSAGVLGSLPFVIALLMSVTNPGYIAPLFSDPRGWIMLAGGAAMLAIGVGIMAKLVSFEI
jgi:tight adherence protein B